MDFQTAWQKARKGERSGLFASEYTYGYPHPQRRQPQRQLTPTQSKHVQTTYHPTRNMSVWSEYGGHSASRKTGYSPLVMEAKSKYAQAVFAQAEYTLSRLKERW